MSAAGLCVERRKGRLYLYARRRVDGRLTGRYLGPVNADEAELFRRPAAVGGEGRRAVVEADGFGAAVLAAGAEFDLLADRVFRVVMHLAGFRLHRRSAWRRQRGVVSMKGLDDILKPARQPDGPAPAIFKPVSTVPAHQTILDQAAAGDRSVLPAVRKLLADETYSSGWGAMASVAEHALARMAAGDDLLVAEAVRKKIGEYVRNLLADGAEGHTYAETLAATRAAHNWVTLHILECKAAGLPADGPAAVALDRRVSQAERRLHAALKSLAILRRLRRPAAPAQVNVATTGPVLVDNRGAAAG